MTSAADFVGLASAVSVLAGGRPKSTALRLVHSTRSGVSAYPNAYLSTDELPRRSVVKRGLCLLAAAGISYLGLVILALTFLSTEYSPVTQFASDYGVGTYAFWMNSGFLFAGIGVLSLGAVLVISAGGRAEKAGGALLLPGGVCLVLGSFFATDIEGAAQTFHGLVHGLAGVGFFLTASVGLLLVSSAFGRGRFLLTLAAFVAAAAVLALNSSLGLDATGLTERVAILVIFSTAILTSLRTFGQS